MSEKLGEGRFLNKDGIGRIRKLEVLGELHRNRRKTRNKYCDKGRGCFKKKRRK